MPPAQVGAEGIYFAERLYPAHFAPSPLVCIYKTLEIAFFLYKNRLIALECRTPCPSAPQFKADDFY